MRGVVAGMLLLLAAQFAAAAPIPADLSLAERFVFGEATLLSGRLTFEPARVDHVVLIDASALVLPPGQLVVCPGRDATAQDDPTTGRCRGAETFDSPRVRFGERTWLRFATPLRVERFPNASLSTFVPRGGAMTWAAAVSGEGFALAWDGELRFAPLGRSASVVVSAGEDPRWFNGTDHRYVFLPEDDATVVARADAVVATVPTDLQVQLRRAHPEVTRRLLEPRRLLDAQEVHAGADAREPIANVTAILGSFSRTPILLDAALVGHLNGTLGDAATDRSAVTLVRLRSLDARLNNTTLQGTADARVVLTEEGFTRDDRDVPRPPFALGVGAWLVFGLVWLVVPWAPPRASGPARVTRGVVAAVLLVAWDALVGRALGFNVASLWRSDAPLRSIAPLAAFELVSLLAAWAVLALPLRLATARFLRRSFPGWSPYAPLVGTLALLLAMGFMTHAMLNLALRVAHF